MGLNSLQLINTVRKLVNPAPDLFPLELDCLLETLLEGEMEVQGLMPWSSNYTFLVSLVRPDNPTELLAIYKPCRGERPLWDFPDGSLCYREFASYLVSLVLGWPRIPPTVLRQKAPHGPGSVQLFIEADFEAHYFNLRHITALTDDFQRIALFDYIVNNADRKGGHCLRDQAGQIWVIDHGLTFHTDHKLRTVIWEFCDQPVPVPLLNDLERLRDLLSNASPLCQVLAQLISQAELQAFRNRLDRLLADGHFPAPHSGRNVPYPPV